MNYSEMVKAVSEDTGVSVKEVKNIIGELVSLAEKTCQQDDKLVVKGLGVFSKGSQKATTRYCPLTDKTVDIPAKDYVKFKMNSKLRNAIK